MSIFEWFKGKKRPRAESSPVRRLTEHLWVKLIDLPGYRDWASEYDRLERIIPDLENYHLLVLPADIKQPPPGYFNGMFQNHLDDWYERVAHLDLPRHRVEDYKRGGKFFQNTV